MASAVGTALGVVFVVFIITSPFLIGMFLRSVNPRLGPGKAVSFFSRFLVLFLWWFFPLMKWFIDAVQGTDARLDPIHFIISFAGCLFLALTLWAGYWFRPMEWLRAKKGSF